MSSQASRLRKEDQPSSNASRRIKCTYADCFRYFSSEKDMKSHKKKEPSHEYCYKCDVDCEDDSDLLIHMIESGKHIVCPMCGLEFKSAAGLEAHIPQSHQQSQNLQCVGCRDKFTRAAGLMHHIENNECNVITQEAFERRRAEKAIAKDAWAAQLKPEEANVPRGNISTFSDADTTEHGGVSLLDDDTLPEINVGSSSHRDYLTPSLNLLSLREQYPTLPHLSPPKQKATVDQRNGSDLMSFNDQSVVGPAEKSKPPWQASTSAASTLFKNTKAPLQSANQNNDVTGRSNLSKPPLSTDPNSHISTTSAPLIPASMLDPMNHYNDLTKKFECPGKKCGGIFDSIEAFNDHLTSSAHVGGRTVCPSCLRKFASTMALVAHCEAPSKRCNIRNTANYNQVLREITGGLIGTEGHHIDGSVKYVANDITQPGGGFW